MIRKTENNKIKLKHTHRFQWTTISVRCDDSRVENVVHRETLQALSSISNYVRFMSKYVFLIERVQ